MMYVKAKFLSYDDINNGFQLTGKAQKVESKYFLLNSTDVWKTSIYMVEWKLV